MDSKNINKVDLNKAKHYPNDKETEAREEALKQFNPVPSTTDCTGLIPFAAQDEKELESYRAIIQYTPPYEK